VAASHELIEFTTLASEIVGPARSLDGRRNGIDNPAPDWLDHVGRTDRVGRCRRPIPDLDELAAPHGCGLEPALRSGTGLLIERGAPAGLGWACLTFV
jgi:hypothetical protein